VAARAHVASAHNGWSLCVHGSNTLRS
jgi:hypothetical protein